MVPSLRSTTVERVVERPEAAAHPGDELPVPALRVAAYAVVAVDGHVLLTQMSENTPIPGQWVLPGGGLDHGEAPIDAVVREVHEETGHVLRDVRLADVGSHRFTGRAPRGRREDFQSKHKVNTAGVEQVLEPVVLDVGGSTSRAAWVALGDLPRLTISEGTGRWLAQLLPDILVE
jgi:ADP-ribose pyrophosphatase YjhB (NUDIX family)